MPVPLFCHSHLSANKSSHSPKLAQLCMDLHIYNEIYSHSTVQFPLVSLTHSLSHFKCLIIFTPTPIIHVHVLPVANLVELFAQNLKSIHSETYYRTNDSRVIYPKQITLSLHTNPSLPSSLNKSKTIHSTFL